MLDKWTREQNIIRAIHQRDFWDLDKKKLEQKMTWTKQKAWKKNYLDKRAKSISHQVEFGPVNFNLWSLGA